jgi:hypothetical protein
VRLEQRADFCIIRRERQVTNVDFSHDNTISLKKPRVRFPQRNDNSEAWFTIGLRPQSDRVFNKTRGAPRYGPRPTFAVSSDFSGVGPILWVLRPGWPDQRNNGKGNERQQVTPKK